MTVWRLGPKAVHTDRHQSSIAASRSGPAGRCQHVYNCHTTSILEQIHAWLRSFSPSEFHVYLLDLTARNCLSTWR